jgi:hypothetical protein
MQNCLSISCTNVLLYEQVWKGNLTELYSGRLIQWVCALLRRGVHATPVDDRDHFPRRSLWQQCELDLPTSL